MFGLFLVHSTEVYGTLFLIIFLMLNADTMKKKLLDTIIIGFALFTIFFGARQSSTLPRRNGWRKLGGATLPSSLAAHYYRLLP